MIPGLTLVPEYTAQEQSQMEHRTHYPYPEGTAPRYDYYVNDDGVIYADYWTENTYVVPLFTYLASSHGIKPLDGHSIGNGLRVCRCGSTTFRLLHDLDSYDEIVVCADCNAH